MSASDEQDEPPHVADAKPAPVMTPKKKKRKRRKRSEPETTGPKRPRLSVSFKPTTLRKLHARARAMDLDDSALVSLLVEKALDAHLKQDLPEAWPGEEPQQPAPKRRHGWLGATPQMLGLASIDDRICEALDRESREDERDDE